MTTPPTPGAQPLSAARLEEIRSQKNYGGVTATIAIRDLLQHITALTSQLAEARKDTQRLDWLEKQLDIRFFRTPISGYFAVHDNFIRAFDEGGDSFRAAIDAAQRGREGSK